MKKPIKRLAIIHDICGVGKAALTNIIPVISTLGVEPCPVPTMILTTHTGGFGQPNVIKLDGYIDNAFKHYSKINIEFEAIFIGYLGSITNIEETLDCINNVKKEKSLIVFDPIFGDNGDYYSNFNKNYSDNLKKLISYSNIITPNFTEACILAEEENLKEVGKEELINISRKLHNLGSENVVITSVPLKDKRKIGTSVYIGENDSIFVLDRIRLEKSYPGTGDIFTSVLTGKLLDGQSLIESVHDACDFVERCILESSKYDYPTKEGVLLESVLKVLNN